MKQAQPNKRATREETALRNAQIVYLRATAGATNERIAAKLELSGRQVQRGLSELRKTRPAPRSPKSYELASILTHRYSWLHESVRVLKRASLRTGGVRSPAFRSVEKLQWEVSTEFVAFERTQRVEQVRRATYDDLRAKGPNDVMARLGRVSSTRQRNTSVLMSQSRGLGWHEHDGCTQPRSAGSCGSAGRPENRLSDIARALDRAPGTIHNTLRARGGVWRP